jgi:alkylated DNA repair dioxygenase AlkB
MTFQPGDRVVAESESTERRARYGTVREVVHEDPRARYRIEWDDGRTSVSRRRAALQLVRENAKGRLTHARPIRTPSPWPCRLVGEVARRADDTGVVERHAEPTVGRDCALDRPRRPAPRRPRRR